MRAWPIISARTRNTAADRRRRLEREPGGARAQRVDHCEQATAAAHGSCHGAARADDFLGDREVEPARVAASSGRIAKVEIPEPYNMNSVRAAAEEQSASYGNVNPSGCFCFVCLFWQLLRETYMLAESNE